MWGCVPHRRMPIYLDRIEGRSIRRLREEIDIAPRAGGKRSDQGGGRDSTAQGRREARSPLRRALIGYSRRDADRLFADARERSVARAAAREQTLRGLRARCAEVRDRAAACEQALAAQRQSVRESSQALAESEEAARREADEARERFEAAEAALLTALEWQHGRLAERRALLRATIDALLLQTDAVQAELRGDHPSPALPATQRAEALAGPSEAPATRREA